MNIIVCIKQVIDPEAPPSSFRIDHETNKVILPAGIQPVISTFDEYAVEAALRVKEVTGGNITALSMGADLLREVVKKPLAMGVDDLVLLEDPAFIDGDSWSTAYALSLAIKKIGQFDLILCGRQAADWDSGQVGPGIAEILGLPGVTIARKIEVEGHKARVERVIPDGYEVIEVALPAVITLSNEHSPPRYPTVKGIMKAKRMEPVIWKPSDIGADPSKLGAKGRRARLIKLFQPVRDTKCEVISADTPEESAKKLAQRLREDKVF
ncbi:MAG: electron transfer flavoprotein subunit beta/FixA family protein [Deltaproteobacteria bacterium]|nr:electron transfer flavoprotein subunit beta/FixA family protein [Deltaproteobacteria bacterium]